MIYKTAEELIDTLKQKNNLLRVEHNGNTKIWFSTEIPSDMPIGSDVVFLSRENITLPNNHYRSIVHPLSGWMSFWMHLGGHCWAATAFITISPLSNKIPAVEFEILVLPEGLPQEKKSQFQYGFADPSYLSHFQKGILASLSSPQDGHPIADINIRILNTISDQIDSAPKAFEKLGNRLIETLIISA
jgi:hypothetical protein